MKLKSFIWRLIFLALIVGVAGWAIKTKTPTLGLDLKGGVHIVLECVDTEQVKVTPELVESTRAVIEKRINASGLSEAIVQKEGGLNSRRIIIDVPGQQTQDPSKIEDLIGKTALLQFKLEDGTVILTGANLKDVRVQLNTDPNTPGQALIAFELDQEGTEKFAQATKENIDKQIAIYLDEELLMNPTVKSEITDGKGVIEGDFTVDQASEYVALLKGGSLPLKVNILSSEIIGPSLGEDMISMSTKAAIIAFILIVLYMIVYYRFMGFLASIALAIFVIIDLGILILLNATFSLPAIGGFVLTLGMALDANVIIFERIKEEIRSGKTLKTSISLGFTKAFRTVLDSNITTISGAFAIMYFGIGLIKGFGITLALGVVVSFFSAIFTTRLLIDIFASTPIAKNAKFFGY